MQVKTKSDLIDCKTSGDTNIWEEILGIIGSDAFSDMWFKWGFCSVFLVSPDSKEPSPVAQGSPPARKEAIERPRPWGRRWTQREIDFANDELRSAIWNIKSGYIEEAKVIRWLLEELGFTKKVAIIDKVLAERQPSMRSPRARGEGS